MSVNPNEAFSTGIKTAIRRIERGPNGTPIVAYFDASTGERLSSVEGYVIITAGNPENPSFVQPTTPQEEVEETQDDAGDTANRLVASEVGRSVEQGLAGRPASREGGFTGGFFDRSPGNNYGYINQPGFLNFTQMMPGPVGTASKVAKAGIGINNLSATNEARETIGLSPKNNFGSIVGSILGIRDPQRVANVSINNKSYSVGLEAQTKQGVTTLTPNEARQRSLVTQGTLPVELDPRTSQAQAPQQGGRGLGGFIEGAVQGIGNAARNIGQGIGNIFGGRQNDSGGGFTNNSYPSAPSPQVQNSVNSGGPGFRDAPDNSRPTGSSISPGLNDAADRGAAGLW